MADGYDSPVIPRHRPRWLLAALAGAVLIAVVLVLVWPTSEITGIADRVAAAMTAGDQREFQAVLCDSVPQPRWPGAQLDRLRPLHVSVLSVDDPGTDSLVVPDATLAVDNTDLRFMVAIDRRVAPHPCVIAFDRIGH